MSEQFMRRAPAFQLYAADLLADEPFMLSSLSERGLLLTLMSHLWINDTITADPACIARMLGLVENEVISALSGRLVAGRIHPTPQDSSRLYCPELACLKQEYATRQARMAEGGRTGGLKAQERRRKESHPSSHPSRLGKAPQKRRDQIRPEEVLQEGDSSADPWLRDYDSTEERPRHGHALRVDWGSK